MDLGDYPETRVDLVEVKDPQGCKNRYYQVVGTDVYIPTFPNFPEILHKFPQIQAREDDILICGYMKSGTHWVWEIVGMLTQGEAKYVTAIKESVMMEAVSDVTLDDIQSPRVLNTHVTADYIPRDFIKKKCKIVYLLRNPKDLLVSMYSHTANLLPFYGYEGSWSGYFELFMDGKVDYGDWFNYVLDWEKRIDTMPDWPVYVLHYEQLKKDPAKEISKLAEFLGRPLGPNLYSEIADKCSFQKMKQAKSAFDDDIEKADWRDGKPMMYRKGQVGDWKNWFTVSQNERFEAKFAKRMWDSQLRFSYVL